MIEKNLDIIYNKKYLVIVPTMSVGLLEGFNYTFHNTILMKNTLEDEEKVTEFVNKNNFEQLIFVDYQVEYEHLIDNLNKKHIIKFIFTKDIASISDGFIYSVFTKIYSLYEKGIVSKLGVMDYGLFKALSNKDKSIELIKLDCKTYKGVTNGSNTIGILNNEHDPRHSFYNELSAVKLNSNLYAKLKITNKITKQFLKLFKIPFKKCKTKKNVIDNNVVNLYVNFTNNNPLIFLESMDKEIPCILGNSDIIDNNKYLKDKLVLKSDDDINEISEKINECIREKNKILKEYQKFRKLYSKETIKLAEKFLDSKIDTDLFTDDELLLTVVVPVYNTENYLKKSLDSIIKAAIDSMEILVINDGSTDNSDNIINDYVKKYPKLIRYIKQENHGLGNVRNVGLKEAKGKYIASIDSDDTINISFFKNAEKYLKQNIDIVMYDWMTVTNDTKYETAALDWVFRERNRYEGLLFTTIMPSTCNKIIKKDLFKELKITYAEDKFEDLSANPLVMLKAKTIKYFNLPYYEYYIRSNSIMRTKPGYSMIDIIKLLDDRLKKQKELINTNIDELLYYTYSWRIEEYIINQLYTVDEKEINTYIKYVYDTLSTIINNIFENKYYIERVNSLKEEHKNYINKRNKAFREKKLTEFIKQARKKNNFFKLTPPIIYYGEK